jgi:hypothetical protein
VRLSFRGIGPLHIGNHATTSSPAGVSIASHSTHSDVALWCANAAKVSHMLDDVEGMAICICIVSTGGRVDRTGRVVEFQGHCTLEASLELMIEAVIFFPGKGFGSASACLATTE